MRQQLVALAREHEHLQRQETPGREQLPVSVRATAGRLVPCPLVPVCLHDGPG